MPHSKLYSNETWIALILANEGIWCAEHLYWQPSTSITGAQA